MNYISTLIQQNDIRQVPVINYSFTALFSWSSALHPKKVFSIGNSPLIQHLFDHYPPYPIAARIIELYLEYLESGKDIVD